MKILELKDVTPKEPFKDCEVKFIHSENVSLAFWKIKSNGVLPEHSHIHEQVTVVTKGELELTMQGKTQILVPGMVAIIPSNVRHLAKAITDCELTDVFYPIREDYRN